MGVLLRKGIDLMERRLGASMDYLRHMERVSARAVFSFLGVAILGSYRSRLPAAARHIASLVATQAEDCGPCVQICINLAKADGVPASWLRDALYGRVDGLPHDLADVYRFTHAVCAWETNLDDTREAVRRRFGDAGVVELALVIAAARVYPITKRALGYAQTCSPRAVQL